MFEAGPMSYEIFDYLNTYKVSLRVITAVYGEDRSLFAQVLA